MLYLFKCDGKICISSVDPDMPDMDQDKFEDQTLVVERFTGYSNNLPIGVVGNILRTAGVTFKECS